MAPSAAQPIKARRNRHRWLRNIHLYGGLLCSSYLVVYGISSLLFSHPIGRLEREGPVREWVDTLKAPVTRDDPAGTARRVASELALVGRVNAPEWKADEGLSFTVVRPGFKYSVRAQESGVVALKGQRLGLTAVLKGLHDARQYPDSVPLSLWWNFTHITILVLLFSTVSGIILWTGSGRFTMSGRLVLIGGAVLGVALIGWLLR